MANTIVKQTTKICEKCGSQRLRLFMSLNMKQCDECLHTMDWYLSDNQKPLVGSSRDKGNQESPYEKGH